MTVTIVSRVAKAVTAIAANRKPIWNRSSCPANPFLNISRPQRIPQQSALSVRGDGFDTGEDGCPVPGCRPDDGDYEPGIVDQLAVPG